MSHHIKQEKKYVSMIRTEGDFIHDDHPYMVKPVWNDHPCCQEAVFLNSWSFRTNLVQFTWNPMVDRDFHKLENSLSGQGYGHTSVIITVCSSCIFVIFSYRQLGIAYVSATTSAVVTALGLKKFLALVCKSFR